MYHEFSRVRHLARTAGVLALLATLPVAANARAPDMANDKPIDQTISGYDMAKIGATPGDIAPNDANMAMFRDDKTILQLGTNFETLFKKIIEPEKAGKDRDQYNCLILLNQSELKISPDIMEIHNLMNLSERMLNPTDQKFVNQLVSYNIQALLIAFLDTRKIADQMMALCPKNQIVAGHGKEMQKFIDQSAPKTLAIKKRIDGDTSSNSNSSPNAKESNK